MEGADPVAVSSAVGGGGVGGRIVLMELRGP